MAYESPLTIAEVVKDISANKYVLPSIQREFVWSTAQIERLFDSVMQDYCFIFWRYRLLAFYNSNESSASTHIYKLPSRYNLA